MPTTNCNHPTCNGEFCRRPKKERKVYRLKRTPVKRKPKDLSKSSESSPLKSCQGETTLTSSNPSSNSVKKQKEHSPISTEMRNHSLSKPKKIKPISDKRKAELEEYRRLRLQYLKEFPKCAVGLKNCCTKEATEIHHMIGRENDLLNDTQYWLSICRSCHTYITEHSRWAIENGYSFSRTSKLYDDCND